MFGNLNLEKELDYMIKYNLTFEELTIFRLLIYYNEGSKELLVKYFEYFKPNLIELLKSLQDKGIINKNYKIPEKGQTFAPDKIDFNKTIVKSYYKESEDLGSDLFENYPSFIYINGKMCSIKNISKHFNSFEKFCFNYGKSINFNVLTHYEIIDILKQAKERNLISYGICEFIISKKWLELKEILKSDNIAGYNTNELL